MTETGSAAIAHANHPEFESYGLESNENAQISQDSADAVANALNVRPLFYGRAFMSVMFVSEAIGSR